MTSAKDLMLYSVGSPEGFLFSWQNLPDRATW